MKLCWLIPSDRSGGISPVALSCCQQAAKAGHEVTVLMLLEASYLQANFDFRVSSLKLESGAPETPAVLLQWLENNPQDVLFLNGCEEFDAAISYLPDTVQCVYVVHDTAACYWRAAIENEANIEAIVAVSETVASQFRSRLMQPKKLSVIHNGCIFPAPPDLGVARQNDLIFLGGDNPTKGAFDLLNLWMQLAQKNFSGTLHWFGSLAPDFREKISKLPNPKQIQVYGHVPRDCIFSIATSAKVLLMLSRVEPFGMATIEAMSMGCVPVAWDINTGTKEIIIPNQTGLVVSLGDMQTLAAQVLYACEYYDTFNQLVTEQARSQFNASVMWQGYEQLLDSIATLQPIERSKAGQIPIQYQRPLRWFQQIPPWLRSFIRVWVGRSPRLGYWLRDLRGW